VQQGYEGAAHQPAKSGAGCNFVAGATSFFQISDAKRSAIGKSLGGDDNRRPDCAVPVSETFKESGFVAKPRLNDRLQSYWDRANRHIRPNQILRI
jgi:hypothetical protein